MKKTIVALLLTAARLAGSGFVCAVGGGSENYNSWSDEPYRWMVQKAGNGPALILHYADGSPWLEKYFTALGSSTATSLVIGTSAAANDSAVFRQITAAKLIFLRGGDQYQYYKLWNNSLAEQALAQAFEHGGVVGGSSAGLAVLGGVDYIAARNSARPLDCLLNPHHRDITLADDFLPLLPGVLFDSHFTARGRLGRLLAFLAHWQTTRSQDILAIGIDEHTALCVEPNGSATVMGAGSVTILHTNPNSDVMCEPNRPLRATNITTHLLTRGFRFDLATRRLLEAPPSATPVSPPTDELPPLRAGLFLHSAANPKTAELALLRMTDGGKRILLLSGQNDAGFADHLAAMNANVETVALTGDNIESSELLSKIGAHDRLIIAGLSTAELATILPRSDLLAQALHEKLAGDDLLLFAGDAVNALGAEFFTNLTADRYALQDGKLTALQGMALLPHANLITDAFADDDYDENRIGAWLCAARRTLGLNLLLPKDAAVEISAGKLKGTTAAPALILDSRAVTHTDSSDFRIRPSASPRQSTALVNGALHCLSSADSLRFDLRTGTLTSRVAAPPMEARPDRFNLRIFPNPADRFVNFTLPLGDASGSSELLIYNLRGQQVARLTPTFGNGVLHYQWPLSQRFPAGHYIALADHPYAKSRSFIVLHQ